MVNRATAFVLFSVLVAFVTVGTTSGCQLLAEIAELPDASDRRGSDAAENDEAHATAEPSDGGYRPDGDATDARDDGWHSCAAVACPDNQVCLEDLCCIPSQHTGTTLGPYPWGIQWTLAGPVSTLDVSFAFQEVVPDPDVSADVASVGGMIDGQQFTAGLLTDLNDGDGGWYGRMAYLSLKGTDDLELVTPVGTARKLAVVDDLHVPEVLLVRPYDWGLGEYRVRVERRSSETRMDGGTGDWFGVLVHDVQAGADTELGSFFVRRTSAAPARFGATVQQSARLFSRTSATPIGFFSYNGIPPFTVGTMVSGDGKEAIRAESAYYGVRNSDVSYQPYNDRVVAAIGSDTPQCHPEGVLFSR